MAATPTAPPAASRSATPAGAGIAGPPRTPLAPTADDPDVNEAILGRIRLYSTDFPPGVEEQTLTEAATGGPGTSDTTRWGRVAARGQRFTQGGSAGQRTVQSIVVCYRDVTGAQAAFGTLRGEGPSALPVLVGPEIPLDLTPTGLRPVTAPTLADEVLHWQSAQQGSGRQVLAFRHGALIVVLVDEGTVSNAVALGRVLAGRASAAPVTGCR